MRLKDDGQLGFEISKIRYEEGYSLQGIAEKIPGESKQSYYKKENNKTRIKVEDIREISKVLPISVTIERGVIDFNKIEKLTVESKAELNEINKKDMEENEIMQERYSIIKVYKMEGSNKIYLNEKDVTGNKYEGYYAIFDNYWNTITNDIYLYDTEEEAINACEREYTSKMSGLGNVDGLDNLEEVYELTDKDKKSILSKMTYNNLFAKAMEEEYFFFDVDNVEQEFEEMYGDLPSTMAESVPDHIAEKYNINIEELMRDEPGLWERILEEISEEDMLTILRETGYIIELESGSHIFMWRHIPEKSYVKDFMNEYHMDFSLYCEIKKNVERVYKKELLHRRFVEIAGEEFNLWDLDNLVKFLNEDGQEVSLEDVKKMDNVFGLSNGKYLYVNI